MTDRWYERLDITEALEAAGWEADDEYPLEIVRKDGAVFAITNECGDSGLSKDGWGVDFPSDVPVIVIVAACLAAAGQPVERLADVIPLRPTAQPAV
jgi:hypothetical protein